MTLDQYMKWSVKMQFKWSLKKIGTISKINTLPSSNNEHLKQRSNLKTMIETETKPQIWFGAMIYCSTLLIKRNMATHLLLTEGLIGVNMNILIKLDYYLMVITHCLMFDILIWLMR